MSSRIPEKTSAGQDEMRHRQRSLTQRHRTVLLLVDGRRTEDQVLALARQAGAPDECLQDLVDLRLVQLGDGRSTSGRDGAKADASSGPPAGASAGTSPDEGDALMPSLSLPPDSSITDWIAPAPAAEGGFSSFADLADGDDPIVERARDALLRAVRTEAPLAGSITMMRLRRARTRGQLLSLLREVEAHIRKPHRTLVADQTLQQVRAMLHAQPAGRASGWSA